MQVYLFLFIEGILSFVSPCFLPMLPIYLVYLAGDKTTEYKKLIINSIGFILGFSIIYVLLGASASSIGKLLIHHRKQMRIISGLIILILGIYYVLNSYDKLDISILIYKIKEKLHIKNKQSKHNVKDLHFFSSLLFGIAICASWTPCLFSFIGSALTLAANSKTLFTGIIMLFVYSLGMGVPFLIFAIFFGKLKNILTVIQKNTQKIRLISGIILIIVGLSMATGLFGYYLSII